MKFFDQLEKYAAYALLALMAVIVLSATLEVAYESVGILVGGILAVALNIAMVQAFALTPLAWYVVPIAMIILLIVGQASVAGPARRGSNISPAIATRSI